MPDFAQRSARSAVPRVVAVTESYCEASGRPLVAIVGLGGLFPGAPDVDAYWQNILHGVDASCEVPPGRWLIPPEQAYHPSIGRADHVCSTRGYFLDEIPLDASGLTVDATYLAELDDSVRLAVHVARQAWESARTTHIDPTRAGVILGNIVLPTE